jgi:hypothetical protein
VILCYQSSWVYIATGSDGTDRKIDDRKINMELGNRSNATMYFKQNTAKVSDACKPIDSMRRLGEGERIYIEFKPES